MLKTLGMAMIVVVGVLAVAIGCDKKPSQTTAPLASRELTLDLGNKVTLKLVLIPAGKFIMGSSETEKGREENETRHEVTISKPFYMGVTEVTQEQYEVVMGNNPSTYKGKTNPVEMANWNDAVEFCKKLSAKTGKTVQLPTEAQWDYACRAGSMTRFSIGDQAEELHKYGNYCDKSNTDNLPWQDKEHSDGFDKTAPVGSFKPNAWGLYDMHGNIWEWCSDWNGDYPAGAVTDPTGPKDGCLRVLRGGSWYMSPQGCRSARRHGGNPDGPNGYSGFRVAVAAGVD